MHMKVWPLSLKADTALMNQMIYLMHIWVGSLRISKSFSNRRINPYWSCQWYDQTYDPGKKMVNMFADFFIIPNNITLLGSVFEIFILVSEVHGHVNVVFGIKNLSEIEANLNARNSAVTFLNRSVHIFLLRAIFWSLRKKDLWK